MRMMHGLAFGALLVLAAGSAHGQTLVWDFHAGLDGWEGGYSDYSNESGFEFGFGPAPLPPPLDTTRRAARISGMNRSDDMFMFLRRKVEGLVPSARYRARFTVRFATPYPDDAVGIGGSPAISVILKAGVTPVKPVDEGGRMNIDKGDQVRPGRDMDTLGHVGAGPGVDRYTTVERNNAGRAFVFTTAADGSAWIILGTDSGFEGRTTLYYQEVEVVLAREGGAALRNPGTVDPLGAGDGGRVRADGRALEGRGPVFAPLRGGAGHP